MNENTINVCWNVTYVNESNMIRTCVQIVELCELRWCDTFLNKEECQTIIEFYVLSKLLIVQSQSFCYDNIYNASIHYKLMTSLRDFSIDVWNLKSFELEYTCKY